MVQVLVKLPLHYLHQVACIDRVSLVIAARRVQLHIRTAGLIHRLAVDLIGTLVYKIEQHVHETSRLGCLWDLFGMQIVETRRRM